MGTKTCRTCGEDKPMTDYSVNRRLKDGHINVCKPCQSRASAAKYATRRDRSLDDRDTPTNKSCLKCGVTKSVQEYYVHHAMTDGRLSTCKECVKKDRGERYAVARTDPRWKEHKARIARRAALRKRGLTEEEYASRLATQGGGCAICGTPHDPLAGAAGVMCVDHDHVTGATRGIVCHACNVGLGRFKDNPDFLMSAATYLLSHRNLLAYEGGH